MAEHLPGFLFDVERWFGSVSTQRMAFAEKGVYLVMLFQQWREQSKTLPDDPEAVADLVAVTAEQRTEVLAAWSTVRRKFITDRRTPVGRMFNAALERVRRKQRASWLKKVSAGRNGGKASARKRLEDGELPIKQCLSTAERPSTDLKREEEKRSDLNRSDQKKVASLRSVTARSKRPIFTGQRLTVFEWMLDDLMRMLGSHTDTFDLDEWFYTADAKAMREAVVVADWWPWLKAETQAEAQRRGLPIAVANATAPTAGKLTTRMADMVARSREQA